MSWPANFFQTARGEYPVQNFIEQQELSTQAKIGHSILLLKDCGPYLKPPYSKKLQNKLYELRISGKVVIRIFYAIVHEEYYLLHAFKKKSQKTPRSELKIALDRMSDVI